ncbi:DHHC-type zinc finger-containing protein [Tubulinosema ratisbonensis]|uniref:Palmitoyltransferase n=1 Tax=Tubulinosema ratisbonensis TaxID=291195 RepID=A0A437AMD8_9MICR|nr:DHHC-type zinc finger-containing protein [Tubulinosema ratisbonensis]
MGFVLRVIKDIYEFLLTSSYMILNIYTYFIFVGLYCIDSKEFKSIQTIVYFVLYHIMLGLALIMYLRVQSIEDFSTKDVFPPIRIESQANLELENVNPFFASEINAKKTQNLRICEICDTFKPPRSHHCSICNRCYLKYDHHCDLFGSCIFFQKYKFFFQFLIYNLILTLFIIAVYINEISQNPYRKLFLINYIINIGLLTVMLVYNVITLGLHMFLIMNNETTVEFYAINRYLVGDNTFNKIFQEGPITTRISSRSRKVLNPYNLGWYKNWKEVFGDNVFDWFLPTYSTLGDGINFPKNTTEGYAI